MRGWVGEWLRNALIVGGVLGLGLFGWQALTADVPSRTPAIDVCALARPETIARLVPEASQPTAEPGNRHSIWCEVSGWVGEGGDRAEVSLWFGYLRSTRADGESAEQRARDEAIFGGCLNCGLRPTPVRIGDESYEYSFRSTDGRQSAEVVARLGTVTIRAGLDTAYVSRDAMFEALRNLAQEVAARCHATC